MTNPDELERAVERLEMDLLEYAEHGHMVPLPSDIRLILSANRKMREQVERLQAENRDLRSIPWPRAYVLERASEWTRLLREVNGYLKTCRGSCESDMSGRDHAVAASNKLIEMLSDARSVLTTQRGE